MSTPSAALPTAGRSVPRAAGPTRRVRLWDLPLRLFHWGLVAAVTTAVVTGRTGGDWMKVHGWAGFTIVGLLAFRVVWGFIGPAPARFASFAPTPGRIAAYLRGRWQGLGHNPLGALAVFALLGLLAVQAGTGLFANDDIAFTGPFAAQVAEALSSRLTGWHHRAADALLWLIGLHLAAMVFYAVLKRTNLVGPMLTGWKSVPAEQAVAARDIERRGWRGSRLALIVALIVGMAALVLSTGVWLHEDPPPAPVQQQAAPPAAAW